MNSNRKGKVGELEAAHYLAALFGRDVRRGVQYAGGPDSPDLAGLPGLHPEIKRVERLDLEAALAQAETEAPAAAVPFVLHRRNRTAWAVTVRADRLIDFARRVLDLDLRAPPQ